MSKPLSNQDSQRAKSAPVIAHPAFPAIVALWFAALLGIGSLVVPPEKLSAVVSALGIPKIVPAAAPPLGFTARALLALLMAGAGVVIGLVVGLRVARSRQVQPPRRTDPTKGRQEKPKRTYAYDPAQHAPELDDERELVRQRGPLRASVAFADIEPLTDTVGPVAMTEAEAPSADHFAILGAPQAGPGEEPEPLELEPVAASFDAPAVHEPVFAAPGPFSTLAETEHAAFAEEAAPAQLAPFAQAPAAVETAALRKVVPPVDHDVRAALVKAPLEALGTVQLVERLALAMAGHTATAPKPAAVEPVAVHPEQPLDLAPQVEDEPEADWAPRFAAPEPEPVEAPHHEEPAPAFEPAVAASRPSILEPVAQVWDDEDHDEHAAQVAPPRFLSTRTATAEPAPKALPTAEQPAPFGKPSERETVHMFDDDLAADDKADSAATTETEEAAEDRYPSLLDIQPFQRAPIQFPAPEPVVHEPEPVVVFPGSGPRADAPFAPPPASTLQSRRSLSFHAPVAPAVGVPVTPPELPADPADPDEADRALRAALATLQRMSGSR